MDGVDGFDMPATIRFSFVLSYQEANAIHPTLPL